MTTTHCEFPHESHYLFKAAGDLYCSLRSLKCQRRSAAKATQINRAATQLLVLLAEAIDIPSLRAERVASAYGCTVKVSALLQILRFDAAIEPADHERLRGELSVFTRTLESLERLAAVPANETAPLEPELAEGAPPVPPTDGRTPDVGSDSPGPPPSSPGVSAGSEIGRATTRRGRRRRRG
jgi:hypothetical protein